MFSVKGVKLKGHDDTLCVPLCVAVTKNNRKESHCSAYETGFSPTKVGGIACCDHKMSSASSLGPYQAVCCTEHSPLALGTGHTSWHPSPRRLSSLPLSLFYQAAVTHPSLPTPPPPLPLPSLSPEALSFHSVSAEASVLTKQQAFRRHIKPCPSSVLLASSAHNKRTGTLVSVSGHY